MEIKWYPCDLGDLPFVEAYVFSDPHYGNQWADINRWKYNINYVQNTPTARVILNGDLCESTIKSSKGDIYRQVGTPQDQRDKMIEWLYPIRGKVLGMTTGNHEQRIYRDAGMDISMDIAKALGCTYDPDGIWLRVTFGTGAHGIKNRPYTYVFYATHGYGGARTRGAKAVKVERLSTDIEADIYCMSHDHEVNTAPDIYLKRNPRVFVKDGVRYGVAEAQRKELVKTNAYLKWGGYGRSGGYSPVDLETPTILLRGETIPWIGPSYNSGMRKPEFKVIS
jgi:hypothetical protein